LRQLHAEPRVLAFLRRGQTRADSDKLASGNDTTARFVRGLNVQLVRGDIKVQHGLYRIYEMLEIPASQEDKSFYQVAGYSIFDVRDRRLSKIFSSFQTALYEIDKLKGV
jgi:hypothetical protein